MLFKYAHSVLQYLFCIGINKLNDNVCKVGRLPHPCRGNKLCY